MTPIEAGETILRCIDYILSTYPANYDKVGELDKKLVDLYHEIELTPIDIQRGYRLAKQVQDVRKERRVYKDENELLKAMHDFLNNGQSAAFRNGLANALQKSKHRASQLENRFYRHRSAESGEG